MSDSFIDPDSDHRACGICPSLRCPREAFVIYDRPTREAPFNPEDGFRYTPEGIPVCVHPDRVGLKPDRIARTNQAAPSTEMVVSRRDRWRNWLRIR